MSKSPRQMTVGTIATSLFLLGLILLPALPAAAQLNTGPGSFTVNGLDGAGGMYTPSISPFDDGLMLLSCDMSGSYRSLDNGAKWELIHHLQLHSSLLTRPAFTKNAIYWATGGQLKMSKDKALTWTPVGDAQPWKEPITHIAAIDLKAGTFLAVGTAKGLWSSADGGKTWKEAAAGKIGGMAAVPSIELVYAAVDAGGRPRILCFQHGEQLPDASAPETDGHPVLALAASMDKGGTFVALLAAVDKLGLMTRTAENKWELVSKELVNDVLMAQGQTLVAYAANRKDIFKTSDGGKSWTSIFHMDAPNANVERAWVQTLLGWGYSISPLGLGIDPRNPDVVMVSTQGDFYRSTDGGQKWFQIMDKPLGQTPGESGLRIQSTGLEVTSVWNYVFDPSDENRQYICYTDIGFARTLDKGVSWIWSAKGSPWGNTFYEIAFDPSVKGRIYAACSARHDIPHWTQTDARPNAKGGVCVSDDHGASWRVLSDRLPQLPCTSIVIDPKSTPDKLTMYVSFYEGGVYKSVDGGKTWEKKSTGLGNAGNMHCYKVRIDPKSGNLYCLITAMREGQNTFKVPGGLWKSTDGGENWTDITASAKLLWPTYFAIDPRDENVIYISAATAAGGGSQGGLYKTTDGGTTWKHILTDADLAKFCPPSYTHGMTVQLHPDNPDIIYYGGTHSLWFSKDGGGSFVPYKKFPFLNVQHVTVDPKDPKTIFVSTFGGGVWKGPAEPVNE